MSIRTKAIKWINNNSPETKGKFRASKLYLEEESWTKSKVWWFEFSINDVYDDIKGFSNLLCEKYPNSSEFSLVQVPNKYLIDSKHSLYIRDKKGVLTFSIYLSANDNDKYIEQRGTGSISFQEYVYD